MQVTLFCQHVFHGLASPILLTFQLLNYCDISGVNWCVVCAKKLSYKICKVDFVSYMNPSILQLDYPKK